MYSKKIKKNKLKINYLICNNFIKFDTRNPKY